jgi:methylenetetrahydrofolate reductase (NADPH)
MAGKPGGHGPDQGLDQRDGGTEPAGGLLRQALAAGEFAVTAEIGPPRGASVAPVAHKAALLRDWVVAVNITDNQSATARLAGWAGSLAALGAGVEPIMQLTCRDRNRIALQSELLAASAMGIPNVLLMTGDHPRQGDHPAATPVFDLDGTRLLAVARAMRDEGRLMSGLELRPRPSWLLGAVTDPSGPADAAAARLAPKIDAGAQFVQTQYVFDVPAFAAWMTRLGDLGLLDRCKILAGVGPVPSQRALHHLTSLPGVVIPAAISDRLLAAGGDSPEKFRAAGEELCAETIAALVQIPGLAGLHVLAPGAESSIPAILALAGLRPRQAAAGGPAHAD